MVLMSSKLLIQSKDEFIGSPQHSHPATSHSLQVTSTTRASPQLRLGERLFCPGEGVPFCHHGKPRVASAEVDSCIHLRVIASFFDGASSALVASHLRYSERLVYSTNPC